MPSPVQYESARTSDPATRGYPAECTALALPGGPSELTPTVTEVILIQLFDPHGFRAIIAQW